MKMFLWRLLSPWRHLFGWRLIEWSEPGRNPMQAGDLLGKPGKTARGEGRPEVRRQMPIVKIDARMGSAFEAMRDLRPAACTRFAFGKPNSCFSRGFVAPSPN